MFIREDLCTRPTADRAIVVVESDKLGADAITELRSDGCRKAAIMHAATKMGMFRPAVNDFVDVFALDADGADVIDPQKQKIAVYRARVPIRQSTVL